MSSTPNTPASTAGTSTPSEKRKLKILMLHGYTQSGPLYHAKTRAHEKLLIKAFPSTSSSPLHNTYPGGPQLIYPTAPILLEPADIPGYAPKEGGTPDAWGWWKRETGGEKYVGLDKGLSTIAAAIREAGGIDGVIGFSQGGCAAGFVASLLEDGREEAFAAAGSTFVYPESFAQLKRDVQQGPLKFAVSYSGFAAPASLYAAFYAPRLTTPFLHVIGTLDSVVEESRSLALADACEDGTGKRVLYHPGGHFVPIGKELSGALIGFVRESCEVKQEVAEESVEDMDVPF